MVLQDIDGFLASEHKFSPVGSLFGQAGLASHPGQTESFAENDEAKLGLGGLCEAVAATVTLLACCMSAHWAALCYYTITGM